MASTMAKSVLKGLLRRFRNDQRGNVALTFALAAVPLIGLGGAAIDYSRASTLRAKMASASDAAALAAAKANMATPAERLRLARSVFDQNMAGIASMKNVNFRLIDQANGVRVEVGAKNSNVILGMIGKYDTEVAVFSEVSRGEGYVEVSLVLDNTYSMVNDFPGMKRAATAFTNTLFSSGAASDSLRMSVVPYIASVNVGPNFNMAHMDTTADSPNHARMLRSQWVGGMKNCNPNPNPQPPSGGGGGGGGGDWTPPPPDTGGGDGVWLQDATRKLAAIGQELLGIKPAHALGETPNTSGALSGGWYTPGAPYVTDGSKAFLPNGFGVSYYCYLVNPPKINHFDLFARIPGARWGGCVEARPEPYDVTDDAPTADPRTKFVPYFWADEIGKRGGSGGETSTVNNYMDDGVLPQGWSMDWYGAWEKAFNIFKYNSANTATLTDDLGPNKACPESLLRMTSDKAQILSKINAMRPIKGGGTISSEGMAWGWRTLSPKAPFADGKEYGKAKKFIVLMSDGQNSIGRGPDYFLSHYTAYGFLREGRFNGEYRFDKAEKYLDDRFAKVCENAKAAGITVMTVYFRDNNNSAKNMMKKCATNGQFFYEAVNESELTKAFTQIAAEIGKLRITK